MDQSNTLSRKPVIKVIGVGGGGNNAVNAMSDDTFDDVQFIVANTDAQVLNSSPIEEKLILGEKLTRGLGAGTDPEIGRQAALESRDVIKEKLKNADLVFIAAGMGGGTGTGAAPEIAKIAKDNGSLVVAVVTTPFSFEGNKRIKNAEAGIEKLRENVDAIVVISNNRLLELGGSIPANDTFMVANNVLREGIRTITDLVDTDSHINLDFADVKNILKDKGNAMFGIGIGNGDKAAIEAANKAANSTILETTILGASDAIINISGGKELGLNQVADVINSVKKASGNPDLNVIWGMTIREELKNKIVVAIMATGYVDDEEALDTNETIIEETEEEPTTDFELTDEDIIEETDEDDFDNQADEADEEIPSFMK